MRRHAVAAHEGDDAVDPLADRKTAPCRRVADAQQQAATLAQGLAHARQALAEGLAPAEIRHVALLAVTTTGWPASAAALSWVDDILPK